MIQIDHVIEHGIPDLVIIQKESNKCQVVFALPNDARVNTKKIKKTIKLLNILGNETAMEYASEYNSICDRGKGYSTFDVEEIIGGNRDF